MRTLVCAAACATAIILAPAKAHAIDIPMLVLGKVISIDVTEVTIVAQRFDAREVNPITEGGAWGQWINRLNVKIDWNHFTLGARVDSAVYWNTLSQQCNNPANTISSADPAATTCKALATNIALDDVQRYQNSIYPAKLWATYNNKGIEITVGDAYVQFARGLVLSMRKTDDLGFDNTVRGIKASVTKGPLGFTLIAGMANPSRVDEATGEALFTTKRITNMMSPAFTTALQQNVFGADQLFGAEIQAGRQGPVVLATSFSYLNRCAPNSFGLLNRIFDANLESQLFGACNDNDVTTWIDSLPGTGTDRQARRITTAAQSIDIPKIEIKGTNFGSFYLVGSIQHRDGTDTDPMSVPDYQQGTALYATYTNTIGKNVQNTLEFKDYRNFYPTSASVNATHLDAFSTLAYSSVPTIESITQDNLFGNFNVCVDGGRARTDVRINNHLLVFGQGILTLTKTEQNNVCNNAGNVVGTAAPNDVVVDVLAGAQSDFDDGKTTLNGTLGIRQDLLTTGGTFVYQYEATYQFTHRFSSRVALEIIGRHRARYERGDNTDAGGSSAPWAEGENYTGLSLAPHFVFTQGIEYSTRDLPSSTKFAFIDGYPAWLYLSLGGVYKFTKNSNVRVFVGQQRGGLKCISGVCRIFPAYEGARMELTLRF